MFITRRVLFPSLYTPCGTSQARNGEREMRKLRCIAAARGQMGEGTEKNLETGAGIRPSPPWLASRSGRRGPCRRCPGRSPRWPRPGPPSSRRRIGTSLLPSPWRTTSASTPSLASSSPARFTGRAGIQGQPPRSADGQQRRGT